MKKILIKSEQGYREYVFKVLKAMRSNADHWEGFDRTILEPAFAYMEDIQRGTTRRCRPEEALKYYFKVLEDPKHVEWSELIQSLSSARETYVHEAFGLLVGYDCYDYDDDSNSIREDGSIIEDDHSSPNALKFEDWVQELTYPFMIVQYIASDYDRSGDCFICAVDFVELKEFN